MKNPLLCKFFFYLYPVRRLLSYCLGVAVQAKDTRWQQRPEQNRCRKKRLLG